VSSTVSGAGQPKWAVLVNYATASTWPTQAQAIRCADVLSIDLSRAPQRADHLIERDRIGTAR
jgi:hypothetical protein